MGREFIGAMGKAKLIGIILFVVGFSLIIASLLVR
jgi:hypothetical protein